MSNILTILLKLYSTNKRSLIILVIFTILPSIFSSAILFYFSDYFFLLKNVSISTQFFFFIITSFTMALAITPSTFIAIISGFFFSWNSFLFLIISYLLGSLWGLWFGRIIKDKNFIEFFNTIPGVSSTISNLEKNQIHLIIFARLSPVLPFAMLNILFAQIKISYHKYLIGGLIGMLPRTLLSFWIGTKGRDILDLLQNPNQENLVRIILLILLIISLVGLYLIIKKAVVKR